MANAGKTPQKTKRVSSWIFIWIWLKNMSKLCISISFFMGKWEIGCLHTISEVVIESFTFGMALSELSWRQSGQKKCRWLRIINCFHHILTCLKVKMLLDWKNELWRGTTRCRETRNDVVSHKLGPRSGWLPWQMRVHRMYGHRCRVVDCARRCH